MEIINNKSKLPFKIEDELLESLGENLKDDIHYKKLSNKELTPLECIYLSHSLNEALDNKYQSNGDQLDYEDHKLISRIQSFNDFLIGCIRGATINNRIN